MTEDGDGGDLGEGVTRKPTVLLCIAAAVAASVSVLSTAIGPSSAVTFGAVGAVIFAAGLVRSRQSALDAGALAIFAGIVIGGLEQTAVEPTVVGTIAVVVAWDLGHSAVALGDQLGREAQTRRLETVHVVSSLLIGLFAGTVGYAVYVAGGSQPVAAAVLLLLAAILLIVGLGRRRGRSAVESRSSLSRNR
ncbi:DUF7519 family protein [Natronorubrum texcoconense]|uniref:Uncharacterized protein n=1 Tax=Natronorubrum texcoconense TaxID=1095776 RepID=A0A1G8V749_9EURY|nr:hypothetical protein [Natronorubrum texcoconense]SDJ60990.1 hypothetical protein SAMN04515672_1169 [Natronorubrum texcoconense]